jgi:hypothetical protein
MADIVGLDRIVAYMNQFDFKKIKLSRGSEQVFVRKIKDGETQADLIDAFTTFVDDFITPNGNRDYKLELLGSYSEDPNARLTPVVKVAVAFSGKETTAYTGVTPTTPSRPQVGLPQEISIEKYVTLATENAKLEAQLERLEEKMDELLADDEDDDGDPVGTPQSLGEALNQTLMGKLDTIVDVVIGYLVNKNTMPNPISGVEQNNKTINGISDLELTMMEFRKIHPEIDEDIIRLYHLKKRNPQLFDMLVKQLRAMIDG